MDGRNHRNLLVTAPVALVLTGVAIATSLSGPSRPQGIPEPPQSFTAVGSSDNSANPSCSGKNNTTCAGNAPVKEFDVLVGSVSGMYPGSSSPIQVTFVNPESFAIKVTSVTPAATLSPSVSGCSGGDIQFGSPSELNKVVPRNASATVSIPVGLKSSTNDPCKGKVFTVTVTATAVKN
jgi:hypothetical protein